MPRAARRLHIHWNRLLAIRGSLERLWIAQPSMSPQKTRWVQQSSMPRTSYRQAPLSKVPGQLSKAIEIHHYRSPDAADGAYSSDVYVASGNPVGLYAPRPCVLTNCVIKATAFRVSVADESLPLRKPTSRSTHRRKSNPANFST
jgi:hypothetical protein